MFLFLLFAIFLLDIPTFILLYFYAVITLALLSL